MVCIDISLLTLNTAWFFVVLELGII